MSIDYSNFALPKPKIEKKKKQKFIKGKKHKKTKATEISDKVKEAVWIRDNYRCIYCHKKVPLVCANAHFIKRSQGGLGIEENIVTLCFDCHYQEDHGLNTDKYEKYIENYLKNIYGFEWKKEKLIYKK